MSNDNTSLDLLAAYLGKKPQDLLKNRPFRNKILELIYGATSGGGGGAITSVFGRTGVITASTGDYTFAQIASKPSTVQYMWIVGGANNFATLPGTPTPPIAGATTLVDSSLVGFNVRVYRGGFPLLGINPGDGTTYYTKVIASNILIFSSALVAGEQIIVETIPL